MKQRPDGRWEKKVTVSPGKRKTFYSSEPTEKRAEKDIQQQLLNYTASKDVTKVKFSEVAEAWERDHREKIPDTTWNKTYKGAYQIILEEFSDIYIREINPRDIQRYISGLVSAGYAGKTISNYKSILNMIFTKAFIDGIIEYNFIRDIPIPAGLPKQDITMPSDEDLKIINEHCTGFDLLPYFLLKTGMRISEALAITDKDIDFENKTITVNKKVVHDGNKAVLKTQTKTKAGTRLVPLLSELEENLPKFKGLLFKMQDGEYYTKRYLAYHWNKYKKDNGITANAHQLRHAYATWLVESGIDFKTIQSIIGHADIHLTLQTYADTRKKQIDNARNILENTNLV